MQRPVTVSARHDLLGREGGKPPAYALLCFAQDCPLPLPVSVKRVPQTRQPIKHSETYYYSSCLLLSGFAHYNLNDTVPVCFRHLSLHEQCARPTTIFASAAATMQTASPRPTPLHISKSFSRLDSPSPDRVRSATSSIHNGASPEIPFPPTSLTASPVMEDQSIFSRENDEDSRTPISTGGPLEAPQTFDELPIEIKSLTERYIISSC
jgi:hypothetical protein